VKIHHDVNILTFLSPRKISFVKPQVLKRLEMLLGRGRVKEGTAFSTSMAMSTSRVSGRHENCASGEK
jgi:hypothetical protein